jgi:phosphate transport system permease protein
VEPKRFEEMIARGLMITSAMIVAGSLAAVLVVVLIRGVPALTLDMVTQTPKGGYYLGGEGGILNAIAGSLCLGVGATLVALAISLPIVLYLQKEFGGRKALAGLTRLSLDVMWGVPSIVYGAFGFILMLYLGLRASLLGGIIALSLVELPIMARAMHEVVQMVPLELKEASYALGATRIETALKVVWRQAFPGVMTAILLAFGRGIGDAASVLFTAGFTDRLPTSLMEPVASLPLAVFFQIGTPFPEVQQRAYASATVLLIMVLLLSVACRLLARKSEQQARR